jgi:hypothetical protein
LKLGHVKPPLKEAFDVRPPREVGEDYEKQPTVIFPIEASFLHVSLDWVEPRKVGGRGDIFNHGDADVAVFEIHRVGRGRVSL